MQETTFSSPQLKAEKTAGRISAYTKGPLLGSPAAGTVSAIVISDISCLEERIEKGTGNLFLLEKNNFITENVSAEGTDKKIIFCNLLLKTKIYYRTCA